ncbi:hypothetical protein PT974_06372 [Cladobotryum mycophilum]|uniref:Arginase family protein n=1 Tax=Cladobotryum mycophilum TaxID=491253 RepID=A0ABR0SLD2_9HYPO
MVTINKSQALRQRRRRSTSNEKVNFPSTHDGAADERPIDLEDDPTARAARRWKRWSYLSSFKWWSNEYRYATVCTLSIMTLAILLWHYDGKLAPKFSPGIELDMIVVALMTTIRVAMGSIVETCICQCAWIWVSKTHQLRAGTEAKLEDFKLFDEASGGILGSLALLWRLKGRHLACIGALIVVVTHGFETFSQQLFDNIAQKGYKEDYSLALSTKAAIYSGILATQVNDLEPQCHTANCTWPVIPTLAVCGKCTQAEVKINCTDQTESCTYGISHHTNVTLPQAGETDVFKVNPSADNPFGNETQAVISSFEIMTISKRKSGTSTTASKCSLWVCMKSFNISVADGRVYQSTADTWNRTRFEVATGSHSDEYLFIDIPKQMNTGSRSRYSVSARSLKALRSFMDSLTFGTFEYVSDVTNFSSDWIEAMWKATTDLDSWIARLSLSLTNEMRQHGTIRDPLRTEYEGSASKMADYVHVQWPWMIYPPVFLLVSLYYLVSTIIAAARDDVAVWKGDSLPMLFSRIDPLILALGTNKMDVPNGLDDLGKSKIALSRDERGYWTFEAVQESEAEDSGLGDDDEHI